MGISNLELRILRWREFRSAANLQFAKFEIQNSHFAFPNDLTVSIQCPLLQAPLGQLQADDYAPGNSSESSSGRPGSANRWG